MAPPAGEINNQLAIPRWKKFGGPPRDRTEDPLIKSAGQNAPQPKRYANIQASQSFPLQLIRHHRKLHAAACGQKADKNLLARLIHHQMVRCNRWRHNPFLRPVRELSVGIPEDESVR
jgi:hypothetical protein